MLTVADTSRKQTTKVGTLHKLVEELYLLVQIKLHQNRNDGQIILSKEFISNIMEEDFVIAAYEHFRGNENLRLHW